MDAPGQPVMDAEGNRVIFVPSLELNMVKPKIGTRQSTNGFNLLENEEEVYAELFIPLDVFTGQQRCCSCADWFGCFLTIPKMNSKLEICVTDRRLLMWEAGRKVLPGMHSFWYWYISLCHFPLCLWANKLDKYLDRQVVVNIQDVKAVELSNEKTTGTFGMMCCPSTVEQEQFELKILLTKPVGVFHPGENWMYDKQCNVSYKFLGVTGCGSLEKAQELRRVLDTAVQRNLERDADMVKISQCLMTNAGTSGGLLGKVKQSSIKIPLDEGMPGGTAATIKIDNTMLAGLRSSQLVFALISFAIMIGVIIFIGSAAWLGALISLSSSVVSSSSFLQLSLLYDLVFIALAFAAASDSVPKDGWRDRLSSLQPWVYKSLEASTAFMYLTGISLAFSAIYLKFFGALKNSLSGAASSTTGLLSIRACQLVMAIISLALVANMIDDASVEKSAIPSEAYFLLVVGVLILIGNLAWMAAIASAGTSGSTVQLTQVFCIYDFIFIALTFSSATAAVVQAESGDFGFSYGSIGEMLDKTKASSAFMYLTGILFLCGAAVVHPK